MKAAAEPKTLDMDRDADSLPEVLSTDSWLESDEDEDIYKEEPHEFALNTILEHSNADVAIVHESDVYALAEALGYRFVRPLDLSQLRYEGAGVNIVAEHDPSLGKIVGSLKYKGSDLDAEPGTSSGKNAKLLKHKQNDLGSLSDEVLLSESQVQGKGKDRSSSVMPLKYASFEVDKLKELGLAELDVVASNAIVWRTSYADIFKCEYMASSSETSQCFLQRRRISLSRDLGRQEVADYFSMMRMWSRLSHPNILPLLGFSLAKSWDMCPDLVLAWTDHLSALQYVKENPDCDIIRLITGIAEGLAYIHSQDIKHADIRSNNIAVSLTGEPLIYGFESARDLKLVNGNQDGRFRGSERWMAPEHSALSKEQDLFTWTKKSDVWSFGVTVHELLTKEISYMSIYGLMIPSPPEDFELWPSNWKAMWNICKDCWKGDPEERPSMDDIIIRLKGLSQEEMAQPAEDPTASKKSRTAKKSGLFSRFLG